MTLMLCIGGHLHGTYRRDVGHHLYAPIASDVVYVGRRPTVVQPARTVTYVATDLILEGWRISLATYVEAGLLASGFHSLTVGALLPGSTFGKPREADGVCRWCFGAPMARREYCPRSQCMTLVASVLAFEQYAEHGRWS